MSGPFSLADSAESLAVTLHRQDEKEYPALGIMSYLLRTTKAPLSSLLDGNWIYRRLCDVAMDLAAPCEGNREPGAVIWLIPQEHLAHSKKIIYRHARDNAGVYSTLDSIAWCVGWM